MTDASNTPTSMQPPQDELDEQLTKALDACIVSQDTVTDALMRTLTVGLQVENAVNEQVLETYTDLNTVLEAHIQEQSHNVRAHAVDAVRSKLSELD